MMENHSYDDYFGMLPRGDGFKLGRERAADRRQPLHEPASSLKAFHMPSTCQLDGHPGQDWNASHTVVRQRPQRRLRARQRPGRDGLLGPHRHSLLLRARRARSRVADRWFCSVLAQTYPNRRFLIAGTAAGHRQHERRRRCIAPPPPNGTIFDRLDAHGITWRNYYTDLPGGRRDPVECATKNPNNLAKVEPVLHRRRGGQAAVGLVRRPQLQPRSPRRTRRTSARASGSRRAIINAVMHGPGVGEDAADLDLRRARRLLRPRAAAARRSRPTTSRPRSTYRPTCPAATTATASASRR